MLDEARLTTLLPHRTDRLVLRRMDDADAPVLAAYRDDPDVARWQAWPLPFGLDDARLVIARQAHLVGPTPGEWYQVAVEHDGRMVGDLAVGLDGAGGVATLGYSLAREHQGHGFATEALAGLVDALADAGVHRFVASADPANTSSLRVLERVGFRFECRAPAAVLVRGEWADDVRYAMSADERRAWRDRPLHPPAEVRLVEITHADAREWARVVTHHTQERFVAPVAMSFTDALFPEPVRGVPVVPWLRGVLADGERAGFVMLAEATDTHPDPFLWRLLVDRRHQGRGIGQRVVTALTDRLRAEGHRSMFVSWVEGPGSPRPFYERLGFVPTGELVDGETEARLAL